MANRIKQIQSNVRAVDELVEKLYCDYNGHAEHCKTRYNDRGRELQVCNCGYDELTERLREAVQVLWDSVK